MSSIVRIELNDLKPFNVASDRSSREPLVQVESVSNGKEMEEDEYISPDEALILFTQKVRALMPTTEKVMVGIMCQGENTIRFPKEFIKLIAETGWEVTVDIDD